MADIKQFIHGMPKTELHVHLEGCLTPALAQTLAERNKMDLPEHVTKAATSEGFAFHDLTSFLEIYYPAMTVLQTEDDFRDLAWDYLTKARAQNVRHCELFFDPQAHTTRSVPISTVINGYYSATIRAKAELDMSVSLILCFLRDMSAESAMETLQSALPFKDKFVGVGLDSDEQDNPPSKFTAVYSLARENNLRLTAHCDTDQADSIEHIAEAIHTLKVERLDHGTNILESSELVDHAIRNKIGLTCCPVSDSVVTNTAKMPEMLTLFRQGVLVTINSDDPAYFRAYVNENFNLVLDLHATTPTKTETKPTDPLTVSELVKLVKNGFEISWITADERKAFLREVDDYVAGSPFASASALASSTVPVAVA